MNSGEFQFQFAAAAHLHSCYLPSDKQTDKHSPAFPAFDDVCRIFLYLPSFAFHLVDRIETGRVCAVVLIVTAEDTKAATRDFNDDQSCCQAKHRQMMINLNNSAAAV